MHAWDLLGVEPTQDIRAIKRAYSVKLKTTRPDDDAQAYQELREAYDWAQQYAKHYVAYDIGVRVGVKPTAAEGEGGETNVDEPNAEDAPLAEPAPVVKAPVLEVPPPPPLVAVAAEVAQELAQGPTVETLVADCARVWAQDGGMKLEQEWPRFQAQLEDIPIAQHNRASRAFAQFVADESDLPVAVLVALTRHFQWGLDFRADQLLGPQLSPALYQRLIVAEVFAAFRPERYAQHAWALALALALALARLLDDKRRIWAAVLAACLDCPTRLGILQAKTTTLRALGASRASSQATLGLVSKGGTFQAMLFVLLVGGVLSRWAAPDMLGRSVMDAMGLGIASLALFIPLRESHAYKEFFDTIRDGNNLDWMAAIPLVVAVLIFMDRHYAWLAGATGTPTFTYCMASAYLGIWLLAPTRENPWHTMVLPTFILLLFCVLELVPLDQLPLAVSLAFAWTMGAHVVLRRYPHHFEAWYEALIKLGVLRAKPIYILGIKIIAFFWVVVAIASVPVLLFRMAVRYRVLYGAAAMVASGVLAHAHSTDWQTKGLVGWVLAVVFSIQIFQTLCQKLADYGLKKINR